MTVADLAPGSRVDEFEIVDVLGHGAFSDVFLATDAGGRRVVLKCPHESLMGDVAAFDRFRRELDIARRLDHPGIQHSYEFVGERTRPYLVMEYVEGQTLRARLTAGEPLPVEQAVDFGRQLAAAVAYAHSQGVYHRDLKPENVLVTPDGRLVVTDFGIALMAGARRLTWRWFSSAMGTPDYMAPEQIQGKRGDARTDVYAIGVMLFEMLAGRVPWEGDNALSVMSQHLTSPLPALHAINPAVPPPIEGIVRKSLRKEPAERYQDAGELLHDIENWRDLDLSQFVFRDERPMKAETQRGLWLLIGGISGGFLLASALFVLLIYLANHAHP